MTDDRTKDLRTWGTNVLQALSDAMDKVSRQREGMPGISAADPRTADWFDLEHLDPSVPGRFPGLGGTGLSGSAAPTEAPPTPGAPTGDATVPPATVPPATDTLGSTPTGSPSSGSPPTGTTATATATQSPGVPVAAPEPERSLEELLAELDALIGLADVKAEIHRQVAVLRVEGLREKAGLKSATITRHLVFVGNPGTGKTTVARLVGGIYRALGLLSDGQLVEVDRSELVAGYLGQTAIKTAEVVARAAGGVLFIDEAYSLAGDQYGTEAVDTLVKEMEDRRDDLVLIVAGYPDPMVVFIAANPGLASRFRTTIEFADYTDDELLEIFTLTAAKADYDVPEATRQRFVAILSATPRGPSFGNGRFARNLLEGAIGRHAWRLREVEEPSLEQLRELLPADVGDAPNPLDVDAAPPEPTSPAEPTTSPPETTSPDESEQTA